MKKLLIALPLITLSAFALPAEAGGNHGRHNHNHSNPPLVFSCWNGGCGLMVSGERHSNRPRRNRRAHRHGGWHHGVFHQQYHTHNHGWHRNNHHGKHYHKFVF